MGKSHLFFMVSYLDLKVTATPNGVDVKGYLASSVIKAGLCLPMAEQSSQYYSSEDKRNWSETP